MKTGGSNYWKIAGDSAFPPLGTLHLRRDEAIAELRDMFEHGQRRVTLVCYYSPLNFPAGRENHIWGHIISSAGGAMYPQHQQNLIDLLGIIRDIGYTGFHFRFAASAEAADVNWADTNNDGQPDWNRDQFNENVSFIMSVRDVVEANRGDMPVVYDLGLENANDRLNTCPTHELYCRQLWRRYVVAHGPDDSCAFSVIHRDVGLSAMLQKFKTAGLPFPGCYCFDLYGFSYDDLASLVPVLKRYGEQAKPVYIQECFYNDAESYSNALRVVMDTGLNLQGIFQWDIIRDQDTHYFPDVYPKRYDNYLVET